MSKGTPAKKPAAAVKRRARKAARPHVHKPTTTTAALPTLVEAPPERRFWVNHGPILKDLRELADALAHSISDAQFTHHVTATHNDFANWVEAVLENSACATALRRAKTRLAALRVVKTHLKRHA